METETDINEMARTYAAHTSGRDGGMAYLRTVTNLFGAAVAHKVREKGEETLVASAADERQRIGRTIASLRRKAGLTVRELAAKSGIPYSNISKMESGKYNASITVMSSVLSALGKRLAVEDAP